MAKADKLLKRVNKWVEENPLTPQQLDKIYKSRANSKGVAFSNTDVDGGKRVWSDHLAKVMGDEGYAIPGPNHRFYENGVDNDELDILGMTPKLVTDRKGNKFVEAFHWTPKENVEGILKNGLVETLGADASKYQNRKGTWMSFGDKNPMERNYNNNARLGTKEYGMVPVRAMIPYEEWKRMYVDHTGKTMDDQVMVFRAPDNAPWGDTELSNGRRERVTIPPMYLEQYSLPDDWQMYLEKARGMSLPGWNPSMDHPGMGVKGMLRYVPEKDRGTALTKAIKEEKEKYGDYDAWDAAQNSRVDARVLRDVVGHARTQKRLKENMADDEGLWPAISSPFSNSLLKVPFYENMAAPYFKHYPKKDTERYLADLLPFRATRQNFMNTRYNTPVELVNGILNPPKQKKGHFQQGYNISGFEKDYAMNPSDSPRARTFITNRTMDRLPIGATLGREFREQIRDAREGTKNLVKNNIAGYHLYENMNLGKEYLNNAGVDVHNIDKWNSQIDDLLPTRFMGSTDLSKPLKESLMEKAHRLALDKSFAYGTPSQKYALQKIQGDLDESPFSNWGPGDYDKVRKQWAYEKGREIDAWTSNANVNNETLKKIRPIVDDMNRISSMTDDEIKSELIKMRRNELVNDWKKKFSADSLDRVVGHHIGRNIGKYRASRGKYGLDK